MINEKPNNTGWKNKLEEMESAAGDVFNKEALWNKLHARLQTSQKNKKAIWYWVAAACLLFALFISFLSNKTENASVKNISLQKTIDSSSSKEVLVLDNDKSPVTAPSPGNKIRVQFINKNDKIIAATTPKIIKPKPIPDRKDKENRIAQEIRNNSVAPVATTIDLVINLPEKKKLKVVHVNELGEPIVEAPNTARYYERHSFQFNFMNQEGYTSSSLPSNNKVIKIFTSRNIPTN